MQPVALEDVQLTVIVLPATTVEGLAEIVAVAGGVGAIVIVIGVALADTVPDCELQLTVIV